MSEEELKLHNQKNDSKKIKDAKKDWKNHTLWFISIISVTVFFFAISIVCLKAGTSFLEVMFWIFAVIGTAFAICIPMYIFIFIMGTYNLIKIKKEYMKNYGTKVLIEL